MGLLRVAEKKQRAKQTLVEHRSSIRPVQNVPKVQAVPNVEEKKLQSTTKRRRIGVVGVVEQWSDVFKPNTPLLLYSNALFHPYLFKWRAG